MLRFDGIMNKCTDHKKLNKNFTYEILTIHLDVFLIQDLENCPVEGNGTPLPYSCLENPMGQGAW